jgi:Xaa-Pro aminopeptidase
VVKNAGYGENILHASGHGVGLEIHERPFLGRQDGILAPCMPITVEPGIYLEGRGGVRIEDTIEVIAGGYRDLTKATRDFIEW